jgi:AcrR family transcriptional regulator
MSLPRETRAPRGRRPGTPDTKAAILAAARHGFAASGYARTSVRAIAAEAGVDPALVHHYFGTKDELFLAALELPVDPRKVLLPAIAAGGIDGAAERMLRVFLSVWDDPDIQVRLVAVFRGILDAEGERLLRDGFIPVVLEPVGVALGIDRPELRMPLVASQILGLIMLRYVIGVPPLASLSGDDVVAIYAPTVQRYLTGDLP